jgi:hypothetical protein
MTHMLAGLAGGRMVVALEVTFTYSMSSLVAKNIIGWLQLGFNFKLGISCYEDYPGGGSR